MKYSLTPEIKEAVRSAANPFQDEGRLNIAALCAEYNIILLEARFLEPGISGVLFRQKDRVSKQDTWIIYVNRNDPIKRKRFTIAHELGHYFSYKHDSKSTETLDKHNLIEDRAIAMLRSSAVKDECELEANEIAGELLMSEGKIGLLVKDGMNIEELADYFGVSDSAMTVRLRDLGYVLMEETHLPTGKTAASTRLNV